MDTTTKDSFNIPQGFWELLEDSCVLERLAAHIIISKEELSEAQLSRAEFMQTRAYRLQKQAMMELRELNPEITTEQTIHYDMITKKVRVS